MTPGAGGSGGGAPEQCGVTFPSPPMGADSGGDISFTAALHRVNFGDKGTVGLDLDQFCSCHGQPASCLEKKPHCDDEAGRDNGAAEILKTMTKLFGDEHFGSDFFTKVAEKGKWSLLYRVRGYNGQPDDGRVELDLYASTGFVHVDPNGTDTPQWLGQDVWKVSPKSVKEGDVDQPLYRDLSAYVNNWVLVASLPQTEITISGGQGNLSITLNGASVLARIMYDLKLKAYWLTEGQIVGRWKLADVFATLSSFRDSDNFPLCKDSALYQGAKSLLCESADILSYVGGPADPCDAISTGIGFEADAAQLGLVDSTVPPLPPGCPKETDPINDTCMP